MPRRSKSRPHYGISLRPGSWYRPRMLARDLFNTDFWKAELARDMARKRTKAEGRAQTKAIALLRKLIYKAIGGVASPKPGYLRALQAEPGRPLCEPHEVRQRKQFVTPGPTFTFHIRLRRKRG